MTKTHIRICAAAVVAGVTLLLALGDAKATFPGDNGLITFVSDGDIWRATLIGTDPVKVTTLGGDHPAWSRNVGTLDIVFDRDGDIYKMIADPAAVPANLTSSPAADDRQPTYSPDGTQIVFASDLASGVYRLYRMPSAGGTITPITSSIGLPAGSDDDAPEWNWANDRIVFERGVPGDGAGQTAIFSIKADGTDLQRLTVADSPVTGTFTRLSRPKWSPDGSKIVFAGDDGSACGTRLFVMDANGGNPALVNKIGACDVADPGWSPDGLLVIFRATDVPAPDGGDGLFGLRLSNSDRSRLSDKADASSPDWQALNSPLPPTTTTTTTTVPGSSTTTTTTAPTTTTTTATTVPPPTTGGGSSRFGVINGCSSLYVKEGFLTNAFHQQLNCGDGRAVALGATRVGVVNGCGSFYVKQGELNSSFNQQTGCGDAQAIAVSADRVGVINGCGAAYVKQGALTGPFSLQLNCGDAQAVAVTDERLGVINSCGSFYAKEGALSTGFHQQTVCGDTRAIAVSPNRIAVINSCGALYVKEGAFTNPFQLQLGCGDGVAVAITDNRVAIINGCGSMWVKDGALTNGFTQQTQCGDARAIAVAPNRIAVINGCSAAYVKEGALNGPFSFQLNCGDARAIALNNT